MILDSGNRILNQLETRFGHLAIPQILRWIVGLQAFAWIVNMVSPGLLEMLFFDQEAIYSGQIWRVVSWVFIPLATNPLFLVISIMFLFFVSDSLENAWGSFRLNVYVLGSIFVLSIIGLIPIIGIYVPVLNTQLFYYTVFFAFACLYPNQILNLFMVIPIKTKWLGWAGGAFLVATILMSKSPILAGICVILGISPFLITFLPGLIAGLKHQGEVTARRRRFEQANQSDTPYFHECEQCGANDEANPELEFRVNAQGQELCERCRSAS